MEKLIVDLKVSANALEAIHFQKNQSKLNDPVPSLVWGRWDDAKEEGWHVCFYEREKTKVGIFIDAGGTTFYLLQHWMANKLNGKTIVLEENHIIIRPNS